MPNSTARIAATALAALGLVASTAWSAAADCMMDDRPLDQRIAEADIVFVGTVESLAHTNTTATFEVEEIWRGPELEGVVTVVGGSGQEGMATSVDRSYQPNTRYLVFPWADGDRLSDNSCSSTQPWSDELEQFRPDDARIVLADGQPNVVTVSDDPTAPVATGDGGTLLPVALGGAALVAVAGATWFVRRR